MFAWLGGGGRGRSIAHVELSYWINSGRSSAVGYESCATAVSKTMVLILTISLVYYVGVIDAQMIGPAPLQPDSKGCTLTLNVGWFDIEPVGDPLLIEVRIRVIHLFDIPDSGGSFGVKLV